MRMYDAYEKRVMQIAKVKNFVVRFRAVFITFLALIVDDINDIFYSITI